MKIQNPSFYFVDDYGMESFREMEDGKLLFRFGNKAELLEPAELRWELATLIQELAAKYPRKS